MYFFLYDIDSFRRLQIFIMITQAVAMLAYIIYPSIQDLRPAVMPRHNVFTAILSFIYAFDTPTGVCPSLHVAYSMGIMSTWLKYRRAGAGFKAFIVAFVIVICLATAFVKQHSFVDIFWALPVSLLAEILVFGKDWWLPRIRGIKV